MAKNIFIFILTTLLVSKSSAQQFQVTSEVAQHSFFLNQPIDVTYTLYIKYTPAFVEVKDEVVSDKFWYFKSDNSLQNQPTKFSTSSQSSTDIQGNSQMTTRSQQKSIRLKLLSKESGQVTLPQIRFYVGDSVITHTPAPVVVSDKRMSGKDSLLWAFGHKDYIDVIAYEKKGHIQILKEAFPKKIHLSGDTIKIQFAIECDRPFQYNSFDKADFILQKRMTGDPLASFFKRPTIGDLLKDRTSVEPDGATNGNTTAPNDGDIYYLLPTRKGNKTIKLGRIEIEGKTYNLGVVKIKVMQTSLRN